MAQPKFILTALFLGGLSVASGCSSATIDQPPAPAMFGHWPETSTALVMPAGVEGACPRRDVPLCCFGQGRNMKAAMARLNDRFMGCLERYGVKQAKLRLTIETSAGRPSCVSVSARSDLAKCVQATVARYYQHPPHGPQERCDFKYPLVFVPYAP